MPRARSGSPMSLPSRSATRRIAPFGSRAGRGWSHERQNAALEPFIALVGASQVRDANCPFLARLAPVQAEGVRVPDRAQDRHAHSG